MLAQCQLRCLESTKTIPFHRKAECESIIRNMTEAKVGLSRCLSRYSKQNTDIEEERVITIHTKCLFINYVYLSISISLDSLKRDKKEIPAQCNRSETQHGPCEWSSLRPQIDRCVLLYPPSLEWPSPSRCKQLMTRFNLTYSIYVVILQTYLSSIETVGDTRQRTMISI